MKYNGNLAYDLEFDNYSERIEKKVQKHKQETKTKAKAETIKKHRTIAVCAFIFAVCAGFMISRNVTAYESKTQVIKLQKELNALKEYSSQKAFELDSSLDVESVEETAKNKLNMVRPEKYQTVYVNVKQDDVTEITADQVEGLSGVIGIFKGEQ